MKKTKMLDKKVIFNFTKRQRIANRDYISGLCTINAIGGFVGGVLSTAGCFAVVSAIADAWHDLDEIEALEDFDDLDDDLDYDDGYKQDLSGYNNLDLSCYFDECTEQEQMHPEPEQVAPDQPDPEVKEGPVKEEPTGAPTK